MTYFKKNPFSTDRGKESKTDSSLSSNFESAEGVSAPV
ncbi:hypothetical protein LEP1GSC133_2604 [Leptospira borgpetersenii serovar Pomona str. 200901868]|uniref:Uncharacterized protein n=1 Tax=Leptospira borgpetersenii serovar Pomona str. 200901868 TaxID=1192866 RepID=M6VW90_LEPBO|nr:hypothetical protein LEP1GSC133_2604 [Leptospira borgpetersenii serovar Pomona str. 200901868]